MVCLKRYVVCMVDCLRGLCLLMMVECGFKLWVM